MKASDIIPEIMGDKYYTLELYDSSKMKEFARCPRRYFYNYVLGWETPSNHLVFGSSYHIAMEHLLLNGYSIDSMVDAYQLFLEDYRKTYPPSTDELFWPKTPENCEVVIRKYCEEYKDDFDKYELLYTEIGGTVPVTEDIKLTYRMDSVLRDKRSGKIFSLEHKTASSDWNWTRQWELDLGIGTYTHVLNSVFGPENVDCIKMNASGFKRTPKKGWEQLLAMTPLTVQPPYFFLRHHAKRSNSQMRNWMWTAVYYVDQIRTHLSWLMDCDDSDPCLNCFPMNPEGCDKYGGCSYHDFCCTYGNPLRRADVAPIGFVRKFWDPLAPEERPVRHNISPEGGDPK